MTQENSNISRRTFVKGVVASALVASSSLTLDASTNITTRNETEELSGTVFHLSIDKVHVNITGTPAVAKAVNSMITGPTLRWREGDEITIHVTNNLNEDSSIHWHGIIIPSDMDGVPGISFDGIPAGETFTYKFPVVQSGTYWYHSHSGFQEQSGVYGAIIIEPKEEILEYEREYVISLSDWSDENCEGKIALFLEGGYDLSVCSATSLAICKALLGENWEDPLGKSQYAETNQWIPELERIRKEWNL